jgi:hypothetical protein
VLSSLGNLLQIISDIFINVLSYLGKLLQIISNIFGPLITQILSVFGYTAGTVIDKSTDIVTDVAKSGIDLAGDTIQSAAGLLKDASRGNVANDAVRQLDNRFNRKPDAVKPDAVKPPNNPVKPPDNPVKPPNNPIKPPDNPVKPPNNPVKPPDNPPKQPDNSDKNGKSSKIDSAINNSKRVTNQPVPDTSVDPIQKPITAGKVSWCLVGEYQGKRGCIDVNDESKCMSGQVFPSQNMCLNPTRSVFMHSHAR